MFKFFLTSGLSLAVAAITFGAQAGTAEAYSYYGGYNYGYPSYNTYSYSYPTYNHGYNYYGNYGYGNRHGRYCTRYNTHRRYNSYNCCDGRRYGSYYGNCTGRCY